MKKPGVLLSLVLGIGPSLLLGVGCGKAEPPPETPDTVEPEPAPPPPEPEPPKTLAGEDLAKRYVECWQAFDASDWDTFGECFAENAVRSFPDSSQEDLEGPEAIIEGSVKPFKEAFPDAKATPQLVLVNDRNVSSITWLTGTHSGTLKTAGGDIPPSGKKIGQFAFHSVTLDAANQATAEVMINDMGSLVYQLGLSPGPARAAREVGLPGAPIIVVASGGEAEQANVAAVKLFTEQFAKEDIKGISATLADDVIESDQSSAKDMKGKKAVIAGTKLFLGAMGKISYDCPVAWGAGAYVVTLCNFKAVHDGNLGRLKKTNKHVSLTVAEVHELADGKFQQAWRFFDSAAFARQLGLVPGPKGEKASPAASK
ncbi:MAG: nuclear transport factor 2 family protein [Polyangiaceae bacterium]